MSEQSKQYQQIIAKCWADEDFKNQLLADPVSVLKTEGVELPEGISVNAVEDTAQSFTLVIPVKPDDLTDDNLGELAGGDGSGMCLFTGCVAMCF